MQTRTDVAEVPAGSPARLSFGGAVIDSSLHRVGYEVATPGVALIETAAPRARPYRVVLAQNAWNFVDPDDFGALLEQYPRAMRGRIRARRRLAALNCRRAGEVVCLTEHMARLCADRLRRPVRSLPVALPLALEQVAPAEPIGPVARTRAALEPFVLVPGTITWYKQPTAAVDIARAVAARLGRPVRLVLAGTDDGSGCLERVTDLAGPGAVTASTYTMAELRWLYEHAYATVLPSALESLGFGLAEALTWARRVVASPIAPHREVARRIGREPVWLEGDADRIAADLVADAACATAEPSPEWSRAKHEWLAVGRALGLRHRPVTAVDDLPRDRAATTAGPIAA